MSIVESNANCKSSMEEEEDILSNVTDISEMFENAAKEEKEWASYLFKDGSIIGLNETVLHQYVDWLCMSRRKAIGLNSLEEQTLIIRQRAKGENQNPPVNFKKRMQEMNEWRRRMGWIK